MNNTARHIICKFAIAANLVLMVLGILTFFVVSMVGWGTYRWGAYQWIVGGVTAVALWQPRHLALTMFAVLCCAAQFGLLVRAAIAVAFMDDPIWGDQVLWQVPHILTPLLSITSFVYPSQPRVPSGKCPQCKYDLRGDFVAGCPECGWGRET